VLAPLDGRDLQPEIPRYTLRHAPEHLADRPELPELLARPGWRAAVQRTYSLTGCRRAVERAWAVAEGRWQKQTEALRAVNLVACALTLATLRSTLPPELVLEIVVRKLWTPDQAREYALHYEIASDQNMVLEHLLDLRARPQPPDDPAFQNALNELDEITQIESPDDRAGELNEWAAQWQPGVTYKDKQDEGQEKLDGLLATLATPAPATGPGDTPGRHDLEPLLNDLFAYEAGLPGPIDNPDLAQRLITIGETWASTSRPRFIGRLSTILRALTRYPQVDLLYSLELLAPALHRHLPPNAIARLRQVVPILVRRR
jgi:hypothetical protein